MNPTLELFLDGQSLFSSNGSWLYPLFELEAYLQDCPYKPQDLLVRDKIAGKASALLLLRLGIGEIQAGILSRLGKQVLEARQIPYRYEILVDRIECQTESILEHIEDEEEAYRILKKRAGR